MFIIDNGRYQTDSNPNSLIVLNCMNVCELFTKKRFIKKER